MQGIREPAVAGAFYPADAAALRALVEAALASAPPAPAGAAPPKAVIVPHAGYVYSGRVAARAYACVAPLRGRAQRVVLLGPSHRVAFRGLAVSRATGFRTPLGDVAVDLEGVARALELPHVEVLESAHAREHSLEVQLPFLQATLGEFRLVPIVVGWAGAEDVAAVVEGLWGEGETLVVVSSDLSHYLDYESARRLDESTRRAIEALDARAIGEEQACGRLPVQGLLLAARRRGMRVRTLEVCSSGDTAGDRERVVGYGAWVLEEAAAPRERAASPGGAAAAGSEDDRILSIAWDSLRSGLRHGRPLLAAPDAYGPTLRAPGACFVTLRAEGGRLRGCTGSLEPVRPLAHDVAQNAFAAGFRDPRFPPVTADELPGLQLHVSILGRLEPLAVATEAELVAALRPGIDGVVLAEGACRGTFLPAVWESLPRPEDFLLHLKRKAGLADAHWSPQLQVWRYAVREIG